MKTFVSLLTFALVAGAAASIFIAVEIWLGTIAPANKLVIGAPVEGADILIQNVSGVPTAISDVDGTYYVLSLKFETIELRAKKQGARNVWVMR